VTADLHKLSVGRADYYLREIAKDREEYLSGQGESPGEWLGGSAAALGMRGECSPEEFQRVFAWRHPQTGEQLGRAPARTPCPPGTWCYAPSKTSLSSTPSATTGPGGPPVKRTRSESKRRWRT
jgi:TrwC relaxase